MWFYNYFVIGTYGLVYQTFKTLYDDLNINEYTYMLC